jgi:hypothetical protein
MRLPTDTGRLKRLLAEPQTVLSRLGLLDGAKRQARGYHILCPAHDEKTASCSVTTGSDGTLAVNCFACDFRGDVFTLVAKVRSLDLRSDFPRVVAEVAALCGEPIAAPLPRRPTPPPRTLPPSNEVAALWQSCLPVTDDPDLARQLRARGIDPAVVADRDLARALPHRGPLPRWARVAAQWWRVAHRCILPLWSLAGELASVHARAVVAPDGTPKGLLPGGYSAKGLFLADAFALSLLRQGIPAWWRWPERPRLFVTEGGIDYLTAPRAPGAPPEQKMVL